MASKCVYEIAEWGQNQSNLKITHLIVQKSQSKELSKINKAISSFKKNGIFHFAQEVGFSVIIKVESLVLKSATKYKNNFTITIYLTALEIQYQ
jgi:hypothetical protein